MHGSYGPLGCSLTGRSASFLIWLRVRALIVLPKVTVDLDVLVRDDLLTFLKNDSDTRGATIICKRTNRTTGVRDTDPFSTSDATHIFDGLNAFPTHIAHLRFGKIVTEPTLWPLQPSSTVSAAANKSTLYHVALQWLSEDRDYRRELEKQGRKARGAKRDEVCVISRSSICLAKSHTTRM